MLDAIEETAELMVGMAELACEMDVRVAVLVRLMVEVEVPLTVSSAATREAPAARTVKRMLEICILNFEVCGETRESPSETKQFSR